MTRSKRIKKVPGSVLDLKGFQSGRLLILGVYSRDVYPMGGVVYRWKARCECGNIKIVNGSHFARGSILSCGCLNQEICRWEKSRHRVNKSSKLPEPIRLPAEDLIGRKFPVLTGKTLGALTVLGVSHGVLYWVTNKRNGHPVKRLVVHWHCSCSCGGNDVKPSTYLSLKSNHPVCYACTHKNRGRQKQQAPKPQET